MWQTNSMIYTRNYTDVLKASLLRLALPVLLLFAACDNEDDLIVLPEEPAQEEQVLITDQSNVTLVNTGDVVVGGEDSDDYAFAMTSTVMTDEGRVLETTLNCCAMAGIAFDYEENKTDSTRAPEGVTLINRGNITIHTKALVERYKDQIQTPDDTQRPYTYFRILAMYVGKNSTVINEGAINVYFDHDPDITSTIYVMGLVGGEGSTLINNGEIHFYGTGSVATRMRGMATFGSNISAFNNSIMTAEIDMCEDARMITTGGSNSNVINDGEMRMRLPGKVLCMTRYGDSNLINNNLIDLTSVDMPEGYESIVTDEDHIICGLYEPLQASRTGMPSLLNRGTINVRIEGTQRSEPLMQGYGMFCDLMAAGGEKLEVNVVNDGTINVSQSGPIHFNMAEAGFVARQTAAKGACTIKLGRWCTTLRDFATTHDLFLAKGVNMNYSGGELQLVSADDYVPGTAYSVAPEALVYDAGGGNFRYEYVGYDALRITSSDVSYDVAWDRTNHTVSLNSK